MNEKQKRLKKVIQIEATTPSKADFMLTHVPFDNLYLEKRKVISEDVLYNEKLIKNLDEHKFLLIQGDNGSGKSHLIRWLKEQYILDVNNEEETILFISRAHNTLQDALEQLLESTVFPDEIKNNELKNIKNARSNVTGEELKKTINFNFTLAIESDERNNNVLLDRRMRKMLIAYLKNDFVINQFLMAKDGPLEKIRLKIENTDETRVNFSESEMFVVSDFDIKTSQINMHLRKRDEKAADHVIKLAEKLSDRRKGDKLKEDIASYLNTKVSGVIQKSMKLQTSDFQKLFMELRKSLKKKGMALTLFIEDINAFTGIDNALMEVLIANHESEGNESYCRLSSVVGSTTDFYNNRMNDSIKERVTTNVYIKEKSILGSPENLSRFAAKYINAINITEEQLEKWVDSGMDKQMIPINKSHYKFSEFKCDGHKFNLFPFTEDALWNLYDSMPENSRSPRLVLRDIIKYILSRWFENPNHFLSDKNNFSNTSIKIRQWVQGIYENTNDRIDPNSSVERGHLLRIWGNATPIYGNDRMTLGGLSKEVFDAFDVFSGLDSNKTSHSYDKNKQENVSDKAVVVKNNTTKSYNEKIEQMQEKSKRLLAIENDINNWLYEGKNISNHTELRDDISKILVSGINWRMENIPEILVSKYVNSRSNIMIEGVLRQDEKNARLILKRNKDTASLLISMANWRHLGKSSWDFQDGEDYFIHTMSWIEKNKKEILAMVVDEHIDLDKLYLWNVAAVYGIKALFSDINISGNMLDIGSEILSSKPNFNPSGVHGDEWKMLQEKISKNRNDEKRIYEYAQGLFFTTVGYGYGKSDYIYTDPLLIEKQVKILKGYNWNLNKIELLSLKNTNSSTILYNAHEIIKSLNNSMVIALDEEKIKAKKYSNYFENSLGADITNESAEEIIDKMIGFLEFLIDEMNMSYESKDFEMLNDLTPAKLRMAIESNEVIINTDIENAMTVLSKNLLETSDNYYELFIKYEKLLTEKEQIFDSKIDSQIRRDIDDKKAEAEELSNSFINTLDMLGGLNVE